MSYSTWKSRKHGQNLWSMCHLRMLYTCTHLHILVQKIICRLRSWSWVACEAKGRLWHNGSIVHSSTAFLSKVTTGLYWYSGFFCSDYLIYNVTEIKETKDKWRISSISSDGKRSLSFQEGSRQKYCSYISVIFINHFKVTIIKY